MSPYLNWIEELSVDDIIALTGQTPNYGQTNFEFKLECIEEFKKLDEDSKRQLWFDYNNEF